MASRKDEWSVAIGYSHLGDTLKDSTRPRIIKGSKNTRGKAIGEALVSGKDDG